MASPPNTGDQPLLPSTTSNNTIKKCGYLKKQKHGHKRFFVLKEPSEGFPARLEYYESEKKWKNKSVAKRVIPLDCCLNINKRADAKHKYLIALYTKDEYFAVAAENEQEQESWYRVLTDLMAEGKVYDGSASNSASSLVGFDEASYGVITPVSAAYKEVWQVNLKSKGLGQSRNLTGVYRLCLSSRTISFVKLNSEVASVILQLMNIRRCGHSDSFFFIEVGRSAATGPGELWMQADDSVVAQNIHETILEAMKAMKELSEFLQSVCFSAIVKARTYNTSRYLQSGYHGDTRRAGLIHREDNTRQRAELLSHKAVETSTVEVKGAEARPSVQGRGSRFGPRSFDLAPGH
ncbi:Insulin receptor substrate 2 [Nibea albiflora]|uniref:Insulin receptor substrate 2 n=1 Tax=Nibea albiflora TaxID=240163 RepID=A0ACB7EFB8_NIBAL|nr:Insulin receptor substrate 2 [Nibea albiflora]